MLMTDLPFQIKKAIHMECKASQNDYAEDLGWASSNMSRIINRKFPNEKTVELLNKIGYDLYIVIEPSVQTRANRLAAEVERIPADLSEEEREAVMKELAQKYFPENDEGDELVGI